jgi:hypothetical protein
MDSGSISSLNISRRRSILTSPRNVSHPSLGAGEAAIDSCGGGNGIGGINTG